MRWLKRWMRLEAQTTPGASAVAFVPMVIASRGLAFVRTLLVAGLLGEAGVVEFGLYQPALELINVLVVVVMLGRADVAERYVARVELERGRAGLGRWLLRQWLGVAVTGLIVATGLMALGPWISAGIWGRGAPGLLAACALTMTLLALYQHLAGVLRGLRAFAAAGRMELLSAVLLVVFSCIGASLGSAAALVLAYALSVGVPLVIMGWSLRRHLGTETVSGPATRDQQPAIAGAGGFAAWSMVRLLLVMGFGFLSLWGVRYLAQQGNGPAQDAVPEGIALMEAGRFAMPLRIAQLLGFLGVTVWASCYGIAARAWSHGQIRRARTQWFGVGRLGLAAVALLALVLMLLRGALAGIFPWYGQSIVELLPGMLGLFLGYALVTFLSGYADLRQQPQRGAALWATVVLVQAVGIAAGRMGWLWGDPKVHMLMVSAAGLAAALVLTAPALLGRPLRFTASGMPLMVLGAAAATLFTPHWVVNWIAGPAIVGAMVFLYAAGLLVRPADRRALRRWCRSPRGHEGFPGGTLGASRAK